MIINPTISSIISSHTEGKRAYLKWLDPEDLPIITAYLDQLALDNDYTKLFVKIKAAYAPEFTAAGYTMEAYIPNYFDGNEDALFLGKYLDHERSLPETAALAQFLPMLQGTPIQQEMVLNEPFTLRILTDEDSSAMVAVFQQVFETYPFPIFDEAFLIQTMQEGTVYFGIFEGTQLVAISSAECDTINKSSEMTDFAVLPSYRGKHFALILLEQMEKHLMEAGFKTLFTIARLYAASMNKTFFNAGYKYSGTLNKNTQIAGNIESMNVWYKHLSES